jgi:hypothetical protein
MKKYTIIKPEQNCGFCGYIWQVIRGIYQNPGKDYYIDFSNSIYRPFGTDNNIWDYFFEQPSTKSKPTEEETEKVVGILFDQASEFVWQNIQPNTNEEIQKRRNEFSAIISNYLKLTENVKNKIETFAEENFKHKKVLGVHLRGTDHPYKKNMNSYMQIIKDKLIDYDKVFVCSDDYDRFRLAEVSFKDKFICYDSLRSKDSPLHNSHYHFRDPSRNTWEYQLKIAEDVLVESFLMSKTDLLICCPDSNVNLLSRAINPNLPSISL